MLCTDDTGTLTLVYFNVKGDQLARLLPVGDERVVSGRVEFYGGMPQMAHPDLVLRPDELDRFKPIEPVYPLTAGLSPRVVQKSRWRRRSNALPALPEWIDPALRERRGWPDWGEAVRRAHAPESEADLSPTTPARERLAYDEIFASQLAVALGARPPPPAEGAGDRRHWRADRPGRGGARLSADRGAAPRDRRDRGGDGASRGAWCACCRAMSAAARPSWR